MEALRANKEMLTKRELSRRLGIDDTSIKEFEESFKGMERSGLIVVKTQEEQHPEFGAIAVSSKYGLAF